jgi:hypothetical protein
MFEKILKLLIQTIYFYYLIILDKTRYRNIIKETTGINGR